MIRALAAHIDAMTQARAHGDLRTIRGHAYPVSEGRLQAWEAEQRAKRLAQARSIIRKFGARHAAEQAFG